MKPHNIVLITCLVMVLFTALVPAACAEDETNVSAMEDPGTVPLVTIQGPFSLSADDGSVRAAELSGQPEAALRSNALSSKSAGAPDTEGLDWENTLGGSWGDGFWDLQPANDGNFIAAGTSGSWDIVDENTGRPVPGYVNKLEAYIVKIDPADGHIIWHKLIGGNGMDGAMSIRQTADGGYIFAGTSDSTDGVYAGLNHGNKDGWVVKLDANRAIQWQVMLGGSQNEEIISIRETPGRDGYIVAGYTLSDDIPGAEGTYRGNTDMYIVRLDLEGNIVWQKIIGGDQYDFASSAIPASDGGFIVAGYSESGSIAGSTTNHGYSDIVLMKLDADTGNVLWGKLVGGKYGEATGFDNVIQPTADGGYILVGQSSSSKSGNVEGYSHGSGDVWVVKLDDEYEIEWETLLGGVEYDDGTAIRQTADESYILVGRTMSGNSGDVGENNGNGDLWVVKIDADGTLLWQDALGGSGYEQSSSILPTADDGFIVAAFTRSISSGNIGFNHGYEDAWLAKLKPRLVVDVKDADTSAFVRNATVVLTDITHAEDREMNATSGRAVFTGSGISGQYRFGRGLEYSVKASAEKYHDGMPVNVTFTHDGQLVSLNITALDRPAIEKTFSMTNAWVEYYSSNDPPFEAKFDGKKYITNITRELKENAGWTEAFKEIDGTNIKKAQFGVNPSSADRTLNDATLHWHLGHGGLDSAGHTAIILPTTYNPATGDFDGDWLYPGEVTQKWGGKNKWVVLQDCWILKDPEWGTVLGTTHGIFGFTTPTVIKSALPSVFLKYAKNGDTLYDSWYKTTTQLYHGEKMGTTFIMGPDGKLRLDNYNNTVNVSAAVRFKTLPQLYQDHLPGLGLYIAPDGDPANSDSVPAGWDCTTGERVDS